MGESQQLTWQHPASLHEKFGDRMRNSPAKWQYRKNLLRSAVIAKCNIRLGQFNEYRYTRWESEWTNSLVSNPLFFQMNLFTVWNCLHQKEPEMIEDRYSISYFTFCSLLTQHEPRDWLLCIFCSILVLVIQILFKTNHCFLGEFQKSTACNDEVAKWMELSFAVFL